MSSQTPIGRVVPFYKGEWNSLVSYEKLDNVLYNGNTYIALKNVPSGIAPVDITSEYWQMVASKGDSIKGDTGSFAAPTASAYDLPYGTPAVALVNATGPDDAKVFSFEFGLPAGPLGFDSVGAHASSIEAGVEATASASLIENDGVTTLQFNFGIPGAAGEGVQSVDGMVPALDTSTGLQNVILNAVRAVQNQGLSLSQQGYARENINAQVAGNYQPAGDYIASPSEKTVDYFLKYVGNNEWVTEAVDIFPSGGVAGYALRKTTTGTEWQPVREVISGGLQGQILSKASNSNYDLVWVGPIQTAEIDNIIDNE